MHCYGLARLYVIDGSFGSWQTIVLGTWPGFADSALRGEGDRTRHGRGGTLRQAQGPMCRGPSSRWVRSGTVRSLAGRLAVRAETPGETGGPSAGSGSQIWLALRLAALAQGPCLPPSSCCARSGTHVRRAPSSRCARSGTGRWVAAVLVRGLGSNGEAFDRRREPGESWSESSDVGTPD